MKGADGLILLGLRVSHKVSLARSWSECNILDFLIKGILAIAKWFPYPGGTFSCWEWCVLIGFCRGQGQEPSFIVVLNIPCQCVLSPDLFLLWDIIIIGWHNTTPDWLNCIVDAAVKSNTFMHYNCRNNFTHFYIWYEVIRKISSREVNFVHGLWWTVRWYVTDQISVTNHINAFIWILILNNLLVLNDLHIQAVFRCLFH